MAVCVIMDAFPDAPEDWRFLKDDEFDGGVMAMKTAPSRTRPSQIDGLSKTPETAGAR